MTLPEAEAISVIIVSSALALAVVGGVGMFAFVALVSSIKGGNGAELMVSLLTKLLPRRHSLKAEIRGKRPKN